MLSEIKILNQRIARLEAFIRIVMRCLGTGDPICSGMFYGHKIKDDEIPLVREMERDFR